MEKNSTATSFEFTVFASNNSKTHIAVDGAPVCSEDGPSMDNGDGYNYDGETFANVRCPNVVATDDVTELIDCKKCLKWFDKRYGDR